MLMLFSETPLEKKKRRQRNKQWVRRSESLLVVWAVLHGRSWRLVSSWLHGCVALGFSCNDRLQENKCSLWNMFYWYCFAIWGLCMWFLCETWGLWVVKLTSSMDLSSSWARRLFLRYQHLCLAQLRHPIPDSSYVLLPSKLHLGILFFRHLLREAIVVVVGLVLPKELAAIYAGFLQGVSGMWTVGMKYLKEETKWN